MIDKILSHPADGSLSLTKKTEIVRGETGWFLISEESPGRWANVSGPFPTRSDARLVQSRYKPCIRGHEWVVYSTAMQEGWLMVQCVECWAMGTIDDPSKEEWSAAYHAPSRPYRWHEDARVTERGQAAPRVVRAVEGPGCECPSERTLPAYRGYERVPGGIWVHPGGLSDQEKKVLMELADFVGGTDLCSKLLPLFIRSCEAHTGLLHPQATHMIIDRIDELDGTGLHCSPSAVARIIREFAAWDASEPLHDEKDVDHEK